MVAIFIGFSRKRGGSPRRQRPGNITLRVYAGVRSVESSAVSSDITVDGARVVVARWVHAQVAAEPGFRGAFLTGSATDLAGAATLRDRPTWTSRCWSRRRHGGAASGWSTACSPM
jgi:hypothetical protein